MHASCASQTALIALEELEPRLALSGFYSTLPTTNASIQLFADQIQGTLSKAMVNFIATHFDGTEKLTASENAQFTSVNPNWVLLAYKLATESGPAQYILNGSWGSDWSSVNANESWFMHAANGQRFSNSEWNWDLNDISNPAWQQYWINNIIGDMQATGTQGVMGDSFTVGIGPWGLSPSDPLFAGTDGGNPADWPGGVTWINQLNSLVTTVQAALSATPQQYLYIPNIGSQMTSWGNINLSALKGTLLEDFGEAGAGFADSDPSDWTLSMDRALQMSAANQIVIDEPHLTAGPTTAMGVRERGYYLASYLLLQGQHTYLSTQGETVNSSDAFYYPEDGVSLGAATTPLASDVSQYLWQGVYRRNFQNGLVLVNPGSTSITLNLGGTYNNVSFSGGGELTAGDFNAAGNYIGGSVSLTSVNQVTIAPGSGLILLNPTTTSASASTTTVSLASPSAVYGQPVVVTATVSAAALVTGTPTGTVTFTSGSPSGTVLGTAALNSSGVATLSVATLPVGQESVFASYGGNSNFLASNSSTAAVLTVSEAGTTTNVTLSSPTSVFGQAETLTATIGTLAPGAGEPTGTVTFYSGSVGGTVLGTATLKTNDVATLSLSNAPVGQDSLFASYSGDGNFLASTSPTPTSLIVSQASTTTNLSLSSTASLVGQPVILTAVLGVAAPGAGMPTGTVSFYSGAVGGTILGTATLNGSDVATLTLSNLPVGQDSLFAGYSGDGNFLASNSSTSATLTVNNPSTTTQVTVSSPTSVLGQSVVLTATIGVAAPGTGTPTGIVTFYSGTVGGTVLGTATLNGSDVATLTLSNLPVGRDSLFANYSGDGNFLASNSSTATTLTVNNPSTTTQVAVSSPTSVLGQSGDLTATIGVVAPGNGTPTGTVTFYGGSLGGTVLGTATLNGSGLATLSLSNLPVGQDSLFASYSGDGNFLASDSSTSTLTVTVSQASTTTQVSVSSPTSVLGQSVVLTATIDVAAPGTGTPTGIVTFYSGPVGSTVLGTATLSGSGLATLSLSNLPVGQDSLFASYGGDSNFLASDSSTSTRTVTVSQASTTTQVSVSSRISALGQSVVLTATIGVAAPGTGTPTGAVTFYSGSVGGTVLGTGTLNGSGVATLTLSDLPLGQDSLFASYAGDSNFLASNSPTFTLTVTASQAGTTTQVSVSSPTSVLGQSVTLTATIAVLAPGTGTPTGTVTFYSGSVGGTVLGSGTLNSSGVATLTLSNLPVGQDSLFAGFSGDGNFLASDSSTSALTETVSQAGTTTQVTVSSPTSVLGQSVTLTATISMAAPGTGTPTGTVTFYSGSVGGTVLGSGTLNSSGVATLTLSNLPVSQDSLFAGYSGDGNFLASDSSTSALTETVSQAGTTTQLTVSSPTSVLGQSVVLTATIDPGTGTPTGTVTFYSGSVGGTVLGTAALNGSGMAALTLSNLPLGQDSLFAGYSGDGNFLASDSSTSALTETVSQASTTTQLTVSSPTSVLGQSVVLTATIDPGTGTPTGTVTFYSGSVGGTVLGTAALNSSGVATLTLSNLPLGQDSLFAGYSGDSNFLASDSTTASPTILTVSEVGTTTNLALSAPTLALGQSVVLTATIGVVAPGTGTPAGTVTFYSGATILGTATLNGSGVATLTLTNLPLGQDSLFATYNGDSDFLASTSTTLTVNNLRHHARHRTHSTTAM